MSADFSVWGRQYLSGSSDVREWNGSKSEKMRVLVVDDDANLGRSIIAHLVRRGLEVSSAASGEEAHRMFRVYDPGLVLLDLSSSGGRTRSIPWNG